MVFVSHLKSAQGQSLSFCKPPFALFNRFRILMTRLLVTRAVRTGGSRDKPSGHAARVTARSLKVDLLLVDFPFDGMNSGYHT